MKSKIKPFLIFVLLLGIILTFKTFSLENHLESALMWIDDFGIWTPIIFILLYICTAGTILPVILATLAAGVLFGVLGGTVVVSIAFCLSSILIYTLGRRFGKRIIPQNFQSSDKFKAITKALKNDGFKLVLMLRFVPILSSIVLNLTCGLIRIKPKDFILATFLGQLPGTVLYCYSGFLAKDIMTAHTDPGRSTGEWILISVGLVATVLVVVLITIKSKEALKNLNS